MQIMFVATALHKEFGGPPKAIVGAASSLARLGHQVEIVVCGQSVMSVSNNSEFFNVLKESGVSVRVLTSRKTRIYGGIGTISESIKTFKRIRRCDVISLHGLYNFQNLVVATFCLINRKPFTLMPHGSLTKYQRQIHFVRKLFVNPLFFGVVLNRAKSIFVATQIEKDEIGRNLQSKTINVGLGIVLPKDISTVKDYQTKRENFNFLFLGRIAPKKRLDLAIDSFQLLPNRIIQNSKLIICGDGNPSYVDSIKSRVKNISISSKLDFRGWVSGQEKLEVLKNADCFLLTSEDENFAIAAAEALAAGVPCILSSHVALSSIVDKFKAGIVFANLTPEDVAAAMTDLFDSDRIEMRMRTVTASLELDWDSVIAKWDLEFRKAVGNCK